MKLKRFTMCGLLFMFAPAVCGLLFMFTLSACQNGTIVTVKSTKPTVVYASFGSDSKVGVKDWSFCQGSGLTCSFALSGSRMLPIASRYLNVALSFDAPVACGSTKAELNVNNPAWYDVFDVSLVDGYSNKVAIVYTPPGGKPVTLGPPAGATGNEKIVGVFPLGCDVCVARCNPPCSIPKSCTPGTAGCKSGTQYAPDYPCQYQGAVKGGGGSIEVIGP